MANFLEELWGSIFTPGPTPTLLIATNVTFAALQAVLLTLLLATYSIHFLILSVLSTGLWWAINWFARELKVAQAKEDAMKKKHQSASGSKDSSLDPDGADNEMDSADDTETEPSEGKRHAAAMPPPRTSSLAAPSVNAGPQASAGSEQASFNTSAAARLAPTVDDDSLRKRQGSRRSLAESTGSLSTDSEWEKVDDAQ